MSTPGQTESLTFTTADGTSLEAERSVVAEPRAAAVICHPHPLYGGNMYNNVVGGLYTAFPRADVEPFRFNFRGVGGSSGSHGDGVAERSDIEAVIGAARDQHPDLPLLLCGYSFGADVALTVIDDAVAGWFVVAPPLRVVPVASMGAGSDERPKRIVSGTADDFRPADQLPDVVGQWPNHRIVPVDGANHFFSSGLDVVTDAALEFASELTG